MRLADFLLEIEDKAPPAPEHEIARLEGLLGGRLPEDYREFLIACNGGYVGGALWFSGTAPGGEEVGAGVHHIGGFRRENYFCLDAARKNYEGRIPRDLMWMMDDPFGNAICLGVVGEHRGRVYFWDHEREPGGEPWDGTAARAGNLTLLANSFTEFVAGLQPHVDEDVED